MKAVARIPHARRAAFSSFPKTRVDDFRYKLERQLAYDPNHDVKSIYKAIKKLPIPDSSAWEVAFDLLIRLKRTDDALNILVNMQKEGFVATDETEAKMMALSLSMTLPEEVTMEEVVYNMCQIVGQAGFTETQFLNLLSILDIYEVDPYLIAVVVNHFRDARPNYVPRMELVQYVVEALVRAGEVEKALPILEGIPVTNATNKLKSISIAYTRMLTAISDTYDWNPVLVQHILRGVDQHKVPRQIPTTLLLAWAVSRKKYHVVLQLYNTIRRDHVLDTYVYRVLLGMPLTFTYSPKTPRFAPLSPRLLFHNMTLAMRPSVDSPPAVVPDINLITTALAGFMCQRDYGAAIVVLRAFPRFSLRLDNSVFYAVVKPLVHRMWGDLMHKRQMRRRQVKWGDHFLGAAYSTVVLSEALVTRVLEQVARETFFLRDPLYAPTAVEALRESTSAQGRGLYVAVDEVPYLGNTMEGLQTRCGPVKYPMPSMETMETVYPQPCEDVDIIYDATPLERLLQRAILAEILLAGQGDVDLAVGMVQDIIREAEEEIVPAPVHEMEGRGCAKATDGCGASFANSVDSDAKDLQEDVSPKRS